MATLESMAIRCNAALEDIESSLSTLIGTDLEAMPRLHRDREMLRVIQLEQIAKWLKELAEAEKASVKDVQAMFDERMAELSASKTASPVTPKVRK